MKLKLKTITATIITLIAFVFNSCSVAVKTHNVLKTYPGPELLGAQALLIKDADKTISFLSINGQEHTVSGTPYKKVSGVLLLPGTYDIKVSFKTKTYAKKRLTWRIFKIPTFHSTKPQLVHMKLEAGYCYRINPGVEIYDESRNIWDWKPYVEDVSGNPDLYLYFVNAPTHPYVYSFHSPSSRRTCYIETPMQRGWMINRSTEGLSFPILLTFWKYTDAMFLTSYVSIHVYFYDFEYKIYPFTINEDWCEELFEITYFQNLRPTELLVEIIEVDETTIETREYIIVKCQMSYHIPANSDKTYDEAILYITQLQSSNISECFVFALVKSKYGKKDKNADFSDEEMKTFTDLINSMECVITQD